MAIILHAALGLLFGLGLVISGMSNPAKVLDFLDVAAIPAGGWDPSLAFVMAGAIAVAAPGFALARRWSAPVLAGSFQPPEARAIDARLLTGAALFGVGWGLAGFCPGPAFTALAVGGAPALGFMAAMLAGMAGARRWPAAFGMVNRKSH
jgi:uncharacterized membrane protein YedE/YeeE